MKTWVYIDHFNGEVVPASWEALGVGKSFGPVSALVFGKGVDAVAEIEAAIGLADLAIGNSIAVNGACLTVTAKTQNSFTADVSAETLAKTTLKNLKPV